MSGPRRREAEVAFLKSTVRKATHAGGAYHGDPGLLDRFIEEECIDRARAPRFEDGRTISGLVAPHMDLWRASEGYGFAYGTLRGALSDEADTFILLGTCHEGMRSPFALCKKAFDTPFGALACDGALADELAEKALFDVYADQIRHREEHSIEFQAVFVRHLLGEERARGATMLPILCGLGRALSRREDPQRDREAEQFVAILSDLISKRGARVVVIAGADLAHIGPKFGDPGALNTNGRRLLETRDRASVASAMERDHSTFFAHTAEDLETRRVCGIGPIYTALRLMHALEAKRSALHHYTQHVTPNEGSIVSHASFSFAR